MSDPRHTVMWAPLESARLGPLLDWRCLLEHGLNPKYDAIVAVFTLESTINAFLKATML